MNDERRKEDTENRAQLAVLGNDVNYIKASVIRIETLISEKYVTKEDFLPVKQIVFGVAWTVLISVILALLALGLK